MKRQKIFEKDSHSTESSESMESDLTSLSSGSSFEIEYSINHHKEVDPNEIQLLLDMGRIVDDNHKLAENITDIYMLQSGDVVLAFVMCLPYTTLAQLLTKQSRKKFANVVKDKREDVMFLHIERICNTPLNEVLRLYRKVNLECQMYLLASRLVRVDKHDREDVIKTYPEFSEDELEYLPYRSEEIFLLKVCSGYKLIEICGAMHRLFLINGEEFNKYLNLIEDEIYGSNKND